MKKLLIALAVLLAIAWIVFKPSPVPGPRLADPDSLRNTRSGPVLGSADTDGTLAWLGIPYAAPPVDELRWRPPQAPGAWSGTLEALDFGQPCPQVWNRVSGVAKGEAGQIVGNEDCLTLNIWAPRETTAALPVLVWLHGGGNTVGTASTYPANRLAGGENLVVVTINYRLGLLGWLSHPALRTGDPLTDSGNFGTLDTIAALRWVRDNIGAFGGDPGNVTVFGESAGGRNVYMLMASPLAKDLFHRAIVQSGAIRTTPRWRAENYLDDEPPGHVLSSRQWLLTRLQRSGRADGPEAARVLLDDMGQEDIRAFLYGMSAEELLSDLDGPAGMYLSTQHFRDGTVIPEETLYQLFTDPSRYNAVPLITGTNRDEMKLFQVLNPEFVERRYGFLPRMKDPERYARNAAYFSDGWRATAVDTPANIIAASGGAPVYTYRWDLDEGASGWLVDYAALLGAAHGLEIGFVFNDFENGITVPGLYNDDNSPGRDALGAKMRSYWAQFAHTGDPGSGRAGDLPTWPNWQAGRGPTLLLDTAAGGGVRPLHEPLTPAMLKTRLRQDPAIDTVLTRCTLYAQLFLRANFGDAPWSEQEYRELGCSDHDPWALEAGL